MEVYLSVQKDDSLLRMTQDCLGCMLRNVLLSVLFWQFLCLGSTVKAEICGFGAISLSCIFSKGRDLCSGSGSVLGLQ